MLPVSESISVAFRIASAHRDDGEETETDDEQKLRTTEDELALAVVSATEVVSNRTTQTKDKKKSSSLNSKNIQPQTNHQHHRHPRRSIDLQIPIPHHCRDGRNLRTIQHTRRIKIRPTQRESKRRIHKPRRKLVDTASDREMCRHFCYAHVAGPDEEGRVDDVCEDDAQGPRGAEGGADADEEASSDAAA